MTIGKEMKHPLRVRLTRGPAIESEHIVDAVIADSSDSQLVWGEADRIVFPRSAIKTIQALPLIATGAADHFQLTDEHLALACSSHNAEPRHLAIVSDWLTTIGGSPAWLECGPARPLGDEAWLDVGTETTPLHNCCSGKHAGFLTLARHLGVPTDGYIAFDHQVQKLVTEVTEVFTGVSLMATQSGADGCGIPTFALPLDRVAMAMARLVDPTAVGHGWTAACERIAGAAAAHPWLVSGTGRQEMTIDRLATETVVAKTGADGVFTAALPNQGLGIACKARDGGKRAADAAILALLARLNVIPAEAVDQPIRNTLGEVVGSISVVGIT